jgi:stringent starvation protein B
LRYDRYAQDAGFRIQISSFGELQISRTDVIIRAFAARLTVGTEAHHIDLPVQAGLQIFIRATSGGNAWLKDFMISSIVESKIQ